MSGWTVLCGEGGEIVGTSGSPGTIVCKPDEIDYSIAIHAYLIEKKERKFDVIFKYKDDTGKSVSHTENVA
jgi:hypothetical protein